MDEVSLCETLGFSLILNAVAKWGRELLVTFGAAVDNSARPAAQLFEGG